MERALAAQLLQPCVKDIFAFCVSRLYDKRDAEDLTNDIICEVLASVGRLKDDAAFYGYMWRIADNTFKRYIRQNRSADADFSDAFCGVYWETPEDKCIEGEEIAILRRELSLLSKQYREVTVKYYVDNRSCTEIAEELKLSVEMVKYYLFKTRKLLREGFDLERTYGEKSYNPSKFGIDFWGNGGNAYIWQTFERKLPGNIVLAAYDKPMSVEELSLELGVSAVYLEDELEILCRYDFVKRIGDKYQTDFLIFKTDYEREFQQKVPMSQICVDTVECVKCGVEELLPKFRNKDLGAALDDNALRWFLTNFALLNALGDFECKTQEKFGTYPRLNATTHGFVFGHDNDYQYSYFNGIYGHCDNRERTAWYAAVNYTIIKDCQWWLGSTEERSQALCDAILGKESAVNKETVAQLVSEGMISVSDGKLKANFPTFSSRQNHQMSQQLQPLSNLVGECMETICGMAAAIFKKHTPKNLMDRCEHLCYVRHQADAMAIIIESLVKQGYLTVPKEKTNLCVYGVKRVE